MLSGTVHRDAALPTACACHRGRFGVSWPVERALESVLGEAGTFQKFGDHVNVRRGSCMARRSEDELCPIQRDPRPHDRERLHRLEGGAWVDQGIHIAERFEHGARRRNGHCGAEVPRLHKFIAFQCRQLDDSVNAQGVPEYPSTVLVAHSVPSASSITLTASMSNSSVTARLGRNRMTLP